jgi:hypothetical protein
MGDYVGRQMRRGNRNLIILGLLAWSIPALVIGLNLRMIRAAFTGPRPLTVAELEKMKDPLREAPYWVSLEADHATPPVLREGTNNVMSTKYVLIPVGDRLMLAAIPISHEGNVYQGRIVSIGGTADKDRIKLLDEQAKGKLSEALAPYQFDGVYSVRGQAFGLLGLMGALFLLGLWPISVALWRIARPERSSTMKRLAALGDAGQVRASIDAEADMPSVIRIRRLRVAPSWLLVERFLGVEAVRLEDVVWVFKRVVRGGANFIEAVVCTRDGGRFGVQGKDAEVDAMLQVIHRKAPWALAGYSPNVEHFWTFERHKVLQAVEERRQQYLADPQAFLNPPSQPTEPPAAGG